MASFSERFGYVKPKEIVRREEIQADLENALCTCYDLLANDIHSDEYEELEKVSMDIKSPLQSQV